MAGTGRSGGAPAGPLVPKDPTLGSWVQVAATGTDPRRLRSAVVGDRIAGTDDGDPAHAWARLDVRVAGRGDDAWCDRLDALGDGAPGWVAWRGAAPQGAGTAVAIVGARRSTGYGREVAAWLAEDLARAGVAIVSGGAVGIDAASHEAALAAQGRTIVVLGCGHAVGYPAVHARAGGLFDRVLAAGGTLLSTELPTAPPQRHRVRARNRIVAALAEAVVVVEGAARSGTLVTAGFAADLGVPVLAVPGDVRAPLSAAPHQLLHEGAAPCRSAGDVLDMLGRLAPTPSSSDVTRPASGTPSALPPRAGAALAAAWPRPMGLDDLAEQAGVPTPALLGALTRARIAGEITLEGSQVRLRRRSGR